MYPGDAKMHAELLTLKDKIAHNTKLSQISKNAMRLTQKDQEDARAILNNKHRFKSKLLQYDSYIKILEWCANSEIGQIPPDWWQPRTVIRAVMRSVDDYAKRGDNE